MEAQSKHFVGYAKNQTDKAVAAREAASQAEQHAQHYAEQAFAHHEHALHRSEQTVRLGQEAFRRIFESDSEAYELRKSLESVLYRHLWLLTRSKALR